MSPEDDLDVMDRISRLAGQINRHKILQAAQSSQPAQTSPSPSVSSIPQNPRTSRVVSPPNMCLSHGAGIDGFPRGTGHHSSGAGWYGGFASRNGYSSRLRASAPTRAHVHRNRSLVLNNSLATKAANLIGSPSANSEPPSASSYVIKNDRHLQLINTSLYNEQTPARTRAVEQTRVQKLARDQAMRNRRERSKLIAHFRVMDNSGGSGPARTNGASPPSLDQHEVIVQGIRFVVAKNGSKLIKVPGDGNSAKATPKAAVVGGVKFYRSKTGNLYRHGIVKAQWQSGRVHKVNTPCRMFSMTGSCSKGPQCRYLHDPSKVAVCKDFLQKGECVNGVSCDLSHELTPERTPTCLHYVRDNCTKLNCKFTHADVSPTAPVCYPFGVYGYCDAGSSCPNRHVSECPDFSNTGVCKTKGCKLPHRERASILRKTSQAADNSPDGDEDTLMEDISSEDDSNSIDSADVDSDEVDEFIGQDEETSHDFTEQRDFIEL